MRKPRPDAKLLHLPPEQHEALCDWMLSGMPYRVIKQRLQTEFEVVTSIASLSGFWEECCSAALVERRRRAVSTADEVAREAAARPGQFDAATVDALKQKAFELSISPTCDAKDMKSLFTLLLKAKDQDLDGQQLALDREKFEAAERRAAQADAAEGVTRDTTLTTEEKDRRYREIFGMQ